MGKAFVFGNNIDTDGIIPSEYLNSTDERELGRHCMEGVDATFPQNVKVGDIIVPTIVIMFIMRVGKLMSIGAEKVILLYNPGIYDTADIISSYVYRRGIAGSDWSFSSAVGLFNSAINFILVISVNKLSNKLTGSGLW